MVTILGGWQSDFSRNWAREGMEIADGFADAFANGIEAVRYDTASSPSSPPQQPW